MTAQHRLRCVAKVACFREGARVAAVVAGQNKRKINVMEGTILPSSNLSKVALNNYGARRRACRWLAPLPQAWGWIRSINMLCERERENYHVLI